MAKGTRPSREAAERAVAEFLDTVEPDYPTVTVAEDGDDGWAFWIDPEDTTSYLHHDLRIEWYGSRWPDSVDYDGNTGNFIERVHSVNGGHGKTPSPAGTDGSAE